MLDKQGYMHVRACTRARAHARVDSDMKYLLLFTATLIRERASVLRYTYTVFFTCNSVMHYILTVLSLLNPRGNTGTRLVDP
jgi:hypothetical protein